MRGEDVFYLALTAAVGYVGYRIVTGPVADRPKDESLVYATANTVFSTPNSSIGSDHYDLTERLFAWLRGTPTTTAYNDFTSEFRYQPSNGAYHHIAVQTDRKAARIVSTWNAALRKWVKHATPYALPVPGSWQSWPISKPAP